MFQSLLQFLPVTRHQCGNNSISNRDDVVTLYCDMYCDVMWSNYTKEIEQILKAGENIGFMNQSKRPTEPCDYSSQSIFVKKSREILVKSVFRITEIRSERTVEKKGLLSCLLRHRNIELVFCYLFVALDLTLFHSYY